MFFLKDILPIINKNNIRLESKTHDTGDIYTFNFTFREGLKWTPGQHGLLFVQHVRISRPSRMFSIASAPDEGIIKVSMRISAEPSEFKKALGQLKPGDTLMMRGPVGNFYLKDEKSTLLVAGGIGITPMRAILKDYSSKKGAYPVVLLYADSRNEFLYKEELDELATRGNIRINYIVEREELSARIKDYTAKHVNSSRYFISGPKPMVISLKDLIKQQGVMGKHIKHDPFIGY